jgi:signal transduction histidine kinase
MRLGSLRGLLLAVSLLFAVLVIGGVALTTYVIVSDGMQVVAYDTTQRVAATASGVIRETVVAVELKAARQGLTGDRRRVAATSDLTSQLRVLLSRSEFAETNFGLYSSPRVALWSSSQAGLHASQAGQRALALRTGVPTRAIETRGGLSRGLFSKADLGELVVHMPVDLPGDRMGILDVTYEPMTEERVIDAIRMPMAMLALSAMLIMIVLMQTSMAWVLNLVDDLRKATDSIDAGRLEGRLPEGGQHEIGELARSLNRLIDRLQRRSEAQSRFVADASHELATPVAGIRGYTSILRAWGADDETVRAEAIDAIDRESRRMARLTSDLLNLLHADQGLRLRSERFDINAVVRERLAATASRVLEKDIEFEGPIDESLWMTGDPERVEDVVSILLDNAAKYTSQGGSVSARTWRHRDEVFVSVSDTGVGVPPDDLDRIFDRFFRSEKARAEGEAGFGLGLAIAKSIVESMGGTIAAESTPGVGTTFTFALPRGRS